MPKSSHQFECLSQEVLGQPQELGCSWARETSGSPPRSEPSGRGAAGGSRGSSRVRVPPVHRRGEACPPPVLLLHVRRVRSVPRTHPLLQISRVEDGRKLPSLDRLESTLLTQIMSLCACVSVHTCISLYISIHAYVYRHVYTFIKDQRFYPTPNTTT